MRDGFVLKGIKEERGYKQEKMVPNTRKYEFNKVSSRVRHMSIIRQSFCGNSQRIV